MIELNKIRRGGKGKGSLMKIKKVTAIILAGGKSSRMCRNKAFIKLKGKTFIEKIIVTLKSIFDEVIIVANEVEKLKGLKVRVVKDIVPNRGPLSGIHSGLVNSKTLINFVVACDMPFLNPGVINQMVRIANGYDAVVVGSNGRLEVASLQENENQIFFIWAWCFDNFIFNMVYIYGKSAREAAGRMHLYWQMLYL